MLNDPYVPLIVKNTNVPTPESEFHSPLRRTAGNIVSVKLGTRFKLRDDKADPYHQIIKLYQQRKAEAERAGQVLNILDIYNGRDLTITTTAESTSAPQILDVSISTPLSTDEEQMRKWIYDEKKWQDVFACKDYDYLNLVAQMKVPYKDKETGAWISKEDYEAKY